MEALKTAMDVDLHKSLVDLLQEKINEVIINNARKEAGQFFASDTQKLKQIGTESCIIEISNIVPSLGNIF